MLQLLDFVSKHNIQFSAMGPQDNAASTTTPKIGKLTITEILSNWSEEKSIIRVELDSLTIWLTGKESLTKIDKGWDGELVEELSEIRQENRFEILNNFLKSISHDGCIQADTVEVVGATFAPPDAFKPNCENLKLADVQQECLLEWITSSLQVRREFKNFEIDCWSVEVPIRPFIQGLKVSEHLKIQCETGMTDVELEGIEAMDLTISSDEITPKAAKIRLEKFLKFGKRHEKLEIRTVHPQFFDAKRDLFSENWIVKKIPQDYEEGGEFIGKIFSGFENIHGIQDTCEFSCDYYGDAMRIFCAVYEKSKTPMTLYPF
ncbi:hypothetical protein B9Z55_018171 [Caenorhabditis nigoni]|nr:hypothetical protein B9Z55_018171 [Caenorhabditis nigoni]